jgi:hypothetical protein
MTASNCFLLNRLILSTLSSHLDQRPAHCYYTMTKLLPELWELIISLISNPHEQRMYGVNRLFMTTVFSQEYRRVQLGQVEDVAGFLPSRRLPETVIYVRYVEIAWPLPYSQSWRLDSSQPHISQYIHSLGVVCGLIDAADIRHYYDNILEYHYGAASCDPTYHYDSTRLQRYRSGKHTFSFCDAGLFCALISSLKELQELDLMVEMFGEVSRKTLSRVTKAIWALHGVNIQRLTLSVLPYTQVDILVEPTTILPALHHFFSQFREHRIAQYQIWRLFQGLGGRLTTFRIGLTPFAKLADPC